MLSSYDYIPLLPRMLTFHTYAYFPYISHLSYTYKHYYQ